jgi:NTE family protein
MEEDISIPENKIDEPITIQEISIVEEIKPVLQEQSIKGSADFDTLVISGNSVKGIVTLGALQYATDNFLLNKITTLIGTSCGAMCCYLLAIGYTPIEIIVYICTNQLFEKLQQFNVIAMLNGSGASSFTTIQEQLEKMTISKVGKFLTLKDIKTMFNKTLICVSHNITTNKTEYLGPDNYPDLPCLIAIRMSSNLPLIFDHYKYDGSFWLDGGISNNFPINKGCELGNKILGIFVNREQEEFKVDSNILEYIYKLMFIPIDKSQEYMIDHSLEKYNKKDDTIILKLCFSKFKFFDFSANSVDKLEMFSAGYQQASDILSKI